MSFSSSKFLAVAALALGLVGNPGASAAHPHILATLRVELARSADGVISAVRSSWTYDPAYAAFAMRDIDKDGDGVASEEELEIFAEAQIEALAEFDYFTTLKVGGTELGFLQPKFVRLEQTSLGILRLVFVLPVEEYSNIDGAVTLEVFDANFFAYFTMPKDGSAVRIAGESVGCVTTTSGPEPIDLTRTASIPKAFWAALDGVLAEGVKFANKVTVECS